MGNGANVGGVGGEVFLRAGLGGPAGAGPAAGGTGGIAQLLGGQGSAGVATNGPGGVGGNAVLQGGAGGNGSGTGAGGTGGNVHIIPGIPGTGGAPLAGKIRLGSAGATGFKKMQSGIAFCGAGGAAFDEAFSDAPEIVVCTVNAFGPSAKICNAHTVTAASFTAACTDIAAGPDGASFFSYIAIDL